MTRKPPWKQRPAGTHSALTISYRENSDEFAILKKVAFKSWLRDTNLLLVMPVDFGVQRVVRLEQVVDDQRRQFDWSVLNGREDSTSSLEHAAEGGEKLREGRVGEERVGTDRLNSPNMGMSGRMLAKIAVWVPGGSTDNYTHTNAGIRARTPSEKETSMATGCSSSRRKYVFSPLWDTHKHTCQTTEGKVTHTPRRHTACTRTRRQTMYRGAHHTHAPPPFAPGVNGVEDPVPHASMGHAQLVRSEEAPGGRVLLDHTVRQHVVRELPGSDRKKHLLRGSSEVRRKAVTCEENSSVKRVGGSKTKMRRIGHKAKLHIETHTHTPPPHCPQTGQDQQRNQAAGARNRHQPAHKGVEKVR